MIFTMAWEDVAPLPPSRGHEHASHGLQPRQHVFAPTYLVQPARHDDSLGDELRILLLCSLAPVKTSPQRSVPAILQDRD